MIIIFDKGDLIDPIKGPSISNIKDYVPLVHAEIAVYRDSKDSLDEYVIKDRTNLAYPGTWYRRRNY